MKNSRAIFETDDLVALFGGSIDQNKKTAKKVQICKVAVVGEKDLIVQEEKATFSSSVFRSGFFKVPKSICLKLYVDPTCVVNDRVKEPQLGDLILSFTYEKYKDDPPIKTTGILYKISYNRGKPDKCQLLCNGNLEEVSYDDLIVIQSKTKK